MPPAGLAGLVADVLNRYTALAFPAPGLVALEADLLRWLADLFALPAAAAGTLTSGGSLATFSALVAARNDRLPENQVHHAVAKAARLAGFPSAAVHTVATDSTLRMDMTTLTEAVAADRAGNLQPFCVVASAGTTNTGAIDPLPEIAEFCAREGLWLHVDGAYGAAFVLTDRGRQRLRGIDRADSLYSTHTRASSCPRHRLPTGPRRRRAAGGALRRGCPLPAGHRGARPAGFRRHQPRTHPRLPGPAALAAVTPAWRRRGPRRARREAGFDWPRLQGPSGRTHPERARSSAVDDRRLPAGAHRRR
ncbi:MAG: aminotransferase class I/II-fold pyridoxal phosphate-dependent enzyme [Geodermatophilaceae bacterium]|nr:aminotransferase class I/II-fold pyridoxal phosphate-dependent enzyme [Geodermatophilaceae bacterium]